MEKYLERIRLRLDVSDLVVWVAPFGSRRSAGLVIRGTCFPDGCKTRSTSELKSSLATRALGEALAVSYLFDL